MTAQTKFATTYCLDADIISAFGASNLAVWSDLDNTADAGKMADRCADARIQAFHQINSILRKTHYRVPLVSSTVQHTGAARAGATSTVTLAATASTTDSFYNGARLLIVSGTGAGQERNIISYVGSTGVATVDRAWGTAPASGSVVKVEGVPPEIIALEANIAGTILCSARGEEDRGPSISQWKKDTTETLDGIASGAIRLDAV